MKRTGCKILLITMYAEEKGYLIVEDGVFARAIKIDLSEMKFDESYYGKIEIIIIWCYNGREIAEKFKELLNPKFIIYFSFNDVDDFVKIKLQEMCINEFVIHFYMEIFKNENLSKAFNQAKTDMEFKFFRLKHSKEINLRDFEKLLGKGVVSIPNVKDYELKNLMKNFQKGE